MRIFRQLKTACFIFISFFRDNNVWRSAKTLIDMASGCVNMPKLVITSWKRKTGAHASGLAIDLSSSYFQQTEKIYYLDALHRYFSLAQDIFSRLHAGKVLVDLTISNDGKLLNPHFHIDMRFGASFGWELKNTITNAHQSGLFASRAHALSSIEKTYKNAAKRTHAVYVPPLCIMTSRPRIDWTYSQKIPAALKKMILENVLSAQDTDFKLPAFKVEPLNIKSNIAIIIIALAMIKMKK